MIKLKILENFGWYRPIHYNHKRFERLARLCESPIEGAFWSAGYFKLSELGKVTPQVKIGPYRIDFALQMDALNLAIECDGHDQHSSKEQLSADHNRTRYLECHGWRVTRFTGSDIYRDAQGCVLAVVRLVRAVQK